MNLPHWLITLSTPLSLLTSALSLATTSWHVLYALPTPICCRFLVSTQRLLPMVSSLLRPQFGTHSLLTFALVLHHILSVAFLKPTALIRPSVLPSGSHKCLRFGLWSTLHTLKDFIYLLTYLLTICVDSVICVNSIALCRHKLCWLVFWQLCLQLFLAGCRRESSASHTVCCLLQAVCLLQALPALS